MTLSNEHSKTLRKNLTEPEKILWYYLRNRKFQGYKFRRQVPIGKYIVDFICFEKNMVIELDGAEHLEPKALKYDEERTKFLNSRGLKVIRFYNNDVLNNINSVLECLYNELVSPSSGLQPPSPIKGEGLREYDRGENKFNGEELEKRKLVSPSSGLQPPSPIEGEGLDKNKFTPESEGLRENITPLPKGERVEFLSECNELRNSGEGVCVNNHESVSPSSGLQPPSPIEGEGLKEYERGENKFNGEELEKRELVSPSSGLQPPSPIEGEGLREYDQQFDSVISNKKTLRNWARGVRSKLDMGVLSEKLVQKLVNTNEYKNAKNIMIFYPLKEEVNLLSLMNDKTKTFYLPKIDGEDLLCCKFDENTELCESCFHTLEPVVSPSSGLQPPSPIEGEGLGKNKFTPEGEGRKNIFTPTPDLVVVPALAVDKKNYRLGYGKGFYDRFLSQFNPPVKTIVCIPKELILETIFPNEYDVPVDLIITD